MKQVDEVKLPSFELVTQGGLPMISKFSHWKFLEIFLNLKAKILL